MNVANCSRPHVLEPIRSELSPERNSRLSGSRKDVFAVIDSRNLERECFLRVIKSTHDSIEISAYSSIKEWRENLRVPEPVAILLNIGGRRVSDPAVGAEVAGLVAEAAPTAVIVMAECEELLEMITAVDCGARGYIPASVGVDVIIEAARLTSSGGVFLPSSSVVALREILKRDGETSAIDEHFTSRQAAVAEALRRGKANKTIAYELNMCESTVKVHIRTIMKKLKATNRTQAAYKLNGLCRGQMSTSNRDSQVGSS
jgi:DNA-binding NarL/FixJ family response regulator